MKPALSYPRSRRFLPLSRFMALLVGCAALLASAMLLNAPVSAQDGISGSTSMPVVKSVTPKRTGLEISWQPPTIETRVFSYTIIRSATGFEGEFETVVEHLDGSNSDRNRKPHPPNKTYLDTLSGVPMEHLVSPVFWHYRVRAVFDVGAGLLADGPWSNTYTAAFFLAKPEGLSKFEARYFANQYRFRMTWTAPFPSWSDQSIGVTGYMIYRVTEDLLGNRGPQEFVVEVDADTPLYREDWVYTELFGSLSTHHFTVRARYGVMLSQESSVISMPGDSVPLIHEFAPD